MRWSSYVDLSHNDVYGGVPAMVGGIDDDLQHINVTGFAERSLRGFVDSTHTASSTTSASAGLLCALSLSMAAWRRRAGSGRAVSTTFATRRAHMIRRSAVRCQMWMAASSITPMSAFTVLPIIARSFDATLSQSLLLRVSDDCLCS